MRQLTALSFSHYFAIECRPMKNSRQRSIIKDEV